MSTGLPLTSRESCTYDFPVCATSLTEASDKQDGVPLEDRDLGPLPEPEPTIGEINRNVLITSNGAWKLGGFGFAIPADQASGDSANVHAFHYAEYDVEDFVIPLQPSLYYTAPELVRNKLPSAGYSSDVFSFGCLTYHLITRKPLFDCHNNVKMHTNTLTYLSSEAFSSIPPELVSDLQKMLSSNESFRPSAIDFTGKRRRPLARLQVELQKVRVEMAAMKRDAVKKRNSDEEREREKKKKIKRKEERGKKKMLRGRVLWSKKFIWMENETADRIRGGKANDGQMRDLRKT